MPEDIKIPTILRPLSGDGQRAQDMLDEIQAVLRKYRYTLSHKPHAILLAKLEGPTTGLNNIARVVAEVNQISPYMIEWREIDWSKQPGQVKQ